MAYSGLRLRPMGVGDLLDETINLYRRSFLLFVSIGAVLLVPISGVQVILLPGGLFPRSPGVLSVAAIAVIVNVLANFFVLAATIQAASSICLGEAVTVRSAYSRASQRLLSLVGLGLLYALVVTVLTVTVIGIPFAVYLAVSWGLSYPALIFEGKGIRHALGRSRALTRGFWWRTFGIILLVLLFASVLQSIFSVPVGVLAALLAAFHLEGPIATAIFAAEQAFGTAGEVLVGPVTACAWVLTYFDLRVRKEGFDLEVQAREITAASGFGAQFD